MEKEFRSRITVSEPLPILQRVLAEKRGEYDLAIALTHIGIEEDEKLADSIDKSILIVGGHSHTHIDAAKKVGKSWIVHSGEYGYELGVTDVDVQPSGIQSVQFTSVAIRGGSQQGTKSPEVDSIQKVLNRTQNGPFGGNQSRRSGG
jgi:2',3'-cyclic-nucleotide 2'-phosphodiesterase (5'-nucleotidase family)